MLKVEIASASYMCRIFKAYLMLGVMLHTIHHDDPLKKSSSGLRATT
jgi:hypothetical protein